MYSKRNRLSHLVRQQLLLGTADLQLRCFAVNESDICVCLINGIVS